jgi:hypothetical protein
MSDFSRDDDWYVVFTDLIHHRSTFSLISDFLISLRQLDLRESIGGLSICDNNHKYKTNCHNIITIHNRFGLCKECRSKHVSLR